MSLTDICAAIGELGRPAALYGLVAAILLALLLGRDATMIGVLVGGLATLYGARAAENVGVAKHAGNTP